MTLDIFSIFRAKQKPQATPAQPARLTIEQKRERVQRIREALIRFNQDYQDQAGLRSIDIKSLPEDRLDQIITAGDFIK